jgi:hypothetical protein
MSEKTAFIEMETLNQITIINARLNDCYSVHRSISDGLREAKKLISSLLDKQQSIATDAIVKEARKVNLSAMEIWGDKSKERR